MSSAAFMLAQKGQSVTITYPGPGTYDPATGPSSSSTTETVSGVILPLSAPRYAFKQDGNSLVVAGDQQLLLAPVNASGTAIAQPPVNGTITDANSNVWTIISADPLAPAGTNLLFDCIIRRAA